MEKEKHALTPWGKLVKLRLLEKDMTLVELRAQLQSMGMHPAKVTLIGMMRGYRSGQRSADVTAAINRILGIDEDEAVRPA